jgi:ribosome assembly protein 4
MENIKNKKSSKKQLNTLKKIKDQYKIKDNYDKNREKVKKEFKTGTPNPNKPKPDTNPQTDIDYPKQIMIKLVSPEGEELGSEFMLPVETTTLDLNIMINKLKKLEEATSFVFMIDNHEIRNNLLDTLKKLTNFTSESIINIIYRPESLFSVKPLTRASSTLEGHTDSILCVQFSGNGKYLASGGGDTTVRFWDIETETPIYNGELHKSWVLMLAFSPCSTMLASASVDGSFIVWNPETGEPMTSSIKAHSKWITSLTWKPLHLDEDCKLLASASKDGYLKIWNVKTQHCVLSVSGHSDSITKAIWSGENFIYTSSQDKTIRVWDETGASYNTLTGHAHWVNTMTLSTEFMLRTACFDEKKINFGSRTEMRQYAKKRYEKLNKEKLVSGSDDFTLILWDPLNSSKPIQRMTGHQGLVNHVVFSPDTFYIASASFDKCIKIWDGNTGAFLFNLRGHVGRVYQVAWSADSRLLLSGSSDTTLKCWNIKVKRLMHELPGHADEVNIL